MENDFTVPIRGDTKDLLTKLRDAGRKINDFGRQASNSLQAPQQQATQFANSLQSLGGMAKTAIAGIVGGIGIKSLTKDFMDYHTNLANAVQVMRYDVAEVEALGGAMRRFGGDTQGAVSTLDNLSSALQQARWGQGALVETASKFGIQYMKSNGTLMSSEELLRSLSTQLNRFDKQTKVAIASQLGLDSALLRVIDSGNFDSMISQQKKLALTTQEDLKLATDMESAWLDFKDSITSVTKEISRVLLPPLTKVLKYLADGITFLKDFKYRGTLAFAGLGFAMIPILSKVTAFVSTLKSLSMVTGIMKTVQTVVSGIGTAMTVALSPIGLIALAFIALFLVCEDLYGYFNGKDSLFGTLAKDYPAVQGFLDAVSATVSTIKSAIATLIDFFKDPSWEKFTEILNAVKEKAVAVFTYLGEYLTSMLTKPLEALSGMLDSVGGWISQKTGQAWDAVTSWLPWGGKEAPPITTMPASTLTTPEVATPSAGNNVTISNDVTINGQGMSPQEIATTAETTISKLNRTALTYQDK